MIDLTTLRYFISAFETGTFSQAARANGVSQPSVSSAIQKLEERLNRSLFQRSKSGLTPTHFANRLYYDAVKSVDHLSTMEARLSDQPQRTVRVYCAPDMLINKIAPKLNSLRRNFGALAFHFTDDPLESDLAYLSDKCVPDGHAFIQLAEEPFRIAVAYSHPLAVLSRLKLSDLRDHPMIHRPYCTNADRMELGASQVSAGAEAMNDPQLLELVAAGFGYSFVPESHGDNRNDIVLLTLSDVDTGSLRIGVSHRKSAFAKNLAVKLM